ncbi:TolC family protein [Rubrolithibacter danxiaensis]|uniref:TolC family protein n=1 Tax=Rubrolithibacter danxiaensis TaxID=3390805 RepID=UPI003BF91530
MRKKKVFLFFLLLSSFVQFNPVSGQEILTLEDAVKIALEKNYDIKLISNDLSIDKNNVSLANAGMLPSVNGTFTNNNSIQNSTQTQSNGQVQERNNAKNTSLNYGVGLNWTVFDGFGMFARYDQLNELQKLGEADLRLTILNTIADVIAGYYDLVQQQHQLKAYVTATDISRYRVQTAKNRFQIGKAARLEVLNAQVDFNTDTTNLLRQQQLYHNTQIQLNQILARDVTIKFNVADTIIIDDKLNYATLLNKATSLNPSLQAALISKRIAELDLKQVKADRYPDITVNSGYNFTNSQSALGFATRNTGRGFTYGVTASVNIFNGFLQRRNEKNAAIAIENAQIQFDKLNQSVNAELAAAYQTYLTNLSLVTLEENNQKIARQNLDITLEKFKLGSISTVEVRDAQLNYVNATVRYTSAQYAAKIAEVSLKEIAGILNL